MACSWSGQFTVKAQARRRLHIVPPPLAHASGSFGDTRDMTQ